MSSLNDRENTIQHIAKKVSQKVGGSKKASAHTFSELYLANIPPKDLVNTDPDVLIHELLELWEFAQIRKPQTPKIRVYNTYKDDKKKTPHKTVIEIINDNMPFLVDSITTCINSLGLTIHLLIHPVMSAQRDKKGNLVSICAGAEELNDHTEVSFIHCEINEPCSQEKMKLIEDRLRSILNDVRNAVEDWHPMTGKVYEAITELRTHKIDISSEDQTEIIAFLEWAANHHFTFLGYCEYDFDIEKGKPTKVISKNPLGILRGETKKELTRLFEGIEHNHTKETFFKDPYPLLIAKTTQISPVHRGDPLDCISVKKYDKAGNIVGMVQFFGLFTSVVYNRSAKDIPILRHKVSRIIERSGFSEQWHDGRALLHILESFPRDELLQSSEDWLFDTSIAILHLQNRQRMSLFVREDQFERYMSCLVYIPRDRYDSDLRRKIAEILETSFEGKVSSWQTQLGELAFARVHFIIGLSDHGIPKYDIEKIEQKLIETSLTWRDKLNQELLVEYGEEEGLELFDRYGEAFSRAYQESFSVRTAAIDIRYMEKAFNSSCLQAHMCKGRLRQKDAVQLKLYSTQGSVFLSDVLPVFENLNLRVKGERLFKASPNGGAKFIWIHDFEMLSSDSSPICPEDIESLFLDAFHHVWCGDLENDGLNRLVVGAKFTWRECQLFRVYAKYLKQLRIPFSQAYMEEVLLQNFYITQHILKLFYTRFDPSFTGNRKTTQDKILGKLSTLLEDVESLDEDRILNRFINCIMSTLRTNYFQQENEQQKNYISIKIDCHKIEEMPRPRPLYEIFVYSPTMEAIHLRGGKVARGGLRWSDRPEDFRTEVLGLVKAQMVKNAVIVPTGSKGGFIIKRMPANADRDTMMREAVSCYQTMIRGMLDLTDNLVEGKIVPPEDVIHWDDDDPYLVVAADKGTATFSDYANKVSQDYNFWLGDAFASGGSAGYDHKKMGITARGAWESVKHHFNEMGHDVQKQDTTVIGVGDMSGDVFGNGMLLSKHLKLKAAFNHIHIFVDPDPDPAKSYTERRRLFKLARSTWQDYNADVLSKGGAIFERSAKSVVLSSQVKKWLGINRDKITPNELIQAILKAEADLLWFGGIGTYVKAKAESNTDVGDRINDSLRIDAKDLNVKVIGEGANLAITQKGRIEFALNGGRLNTDAIDNSAGVDTSDHEVNIKVLFGKVIEKGEMDLEKRNKQLVKMTDEVARLVLKDNIWQNQAITMAQSQGHKVLEEQIYLMRDLERQGILDRSLEALPDDVELSRRLAEKQGLTRPELAVIMAYAKISLSQEIIESDLPDSHYQTRKLVNYFPKPLRKSLNDFILAHPLRREIITTAVTNTVVNRMGMTMVNDLERQTGQSAARVVRAYLVVRELLETEDIWNKLDTLHGNISPAAVNQLAFFAYKRIKRLTKWFLRYGGENLDVDSALTQYRKAFDQLKKNIETLLSPRLSAAYKRRVKFYIDEGMPTDFVKQVARMDPLWSALDIITIAQDVDFKTKDVAQVYFALGDSLHIDWLREAATQLVKDTRWQQAASSALVDDLMGSQKTITLRLLRSVKSPKDLFNAEGRIKQSMLNSSSIDNIVTDLASVAKLDLSMLTIASRSLRTFAEVG